MSQDVYIVNRPCCMGYLALPVTVWLPKLRSDLNSLPSRLGWSATTTVQYHELLHFCSFPHPAAPYWALRDLRAGCQISQSQNRQLTRIHPNIHLATATGNSLQIISRPIYPLLHFNPLSAAYSISP